MPVIVAEIGSNWDPDDRGSALEMIKLAADVGADAVKFQDFLPIDELNRPDWWKKENAGWQLHEDGRLRMQARGLNLQFITSVFTTQAVNRAFMNDAIKIASSEIGNQSLLLNVNQMFGGTISTPVYLSVDYRKHGAVVPALAWLRRCRVTLLHCVADYPTVCGRMSAIRDLAEFGLSVGWSSHVKYPECLRAVKEAVEYGATVIEVHLRSHDTPESCPDNGEWSLFPKQFGELVGVVRNG